MLIYKITPRNAWAEARRTGRFTGAPVDQADGYIHFSTADQVAETAAKHFTGQDDLVLVAVETDGLDTLKWETSRGGQQFPHLYDDLSMDAVEWEREMPLVGGVHQLPFDAA